VWSKESWIQDDKTGYQDQKRKVAIITTETTASVWSKESWIQDDKTGYQDQKRKVAIITTETTASVSCASESELLTSLLSHLLVSAIESEPPRPFHD
jgi:hypothetical protein